MAAETAGAEGGGVTHAIIYLVGLVTCLASGVLTAGVLLLLAGEYLARVAGATTEVRKMMDQMDERNED